MRVDIVAVAGGLFSSTVVVRSGGQPAEPQHCQPPPLEHRARLFPLSTLQEGAFGPRTNTAAVDLPVVSDLSGPPAAR